MFNRYMAEDREAFEDLYRPVEDESQLEENLKLVDEVISPVEEVDAIKSIKDEKTEKIPQKRTSIFSELKHLLKGVNIGEIGIVPLLLLAFLIMDVENDEKMLIVALAIVLGI